jgi:hypothetical protein
MLLPSLTGILNYLLVNNSTKNTGGKKLWGLVNFADDKR